MTEEPPFDGASLSVSLNLGPGYEDEHTREGAPLTSRLVALVVLLGFGLGLYSGIHLTRWFELTA